MPQASRKYSKGCSYIYFWKVRFDGSIESLVFQSRRPHSHPNQHTEPELKLIRDMHRQNPSLGVVELWRECESEGTLAVGKACGGFCAAKDWLRRRNPRKSTSPSLRNRCSIRASVSRSM